jgi:hypothetical protein
LLIFYLYIGCALEVSDFVNNELYSTEVKRVSLAETFRVVLGCYLDAEDQQGGALTQPLVERLRSKSTPL